MEKSFEADAIHVAPINQAGEAPAVRDDAFLSNDAKRMAFYGKKESFRRNFGLTSIIGLSCTLMLTWEGVIVILKYGLLNGGPTGAICAYIFVVIGALLQSIVMAEMASMIPLSGGQYNWVAILAPPSVSKFLSYVTGWVNTIAWQAACASAAWQNAGMVEAIVRINYPDYKFQHWHGVLIFYAIIAVSLLLNTYLGSVFPQFEILALFLHVVGFFAILITLVYLSPKSDPKVVFQTFINGGEFSSYGISFLQGSTAWMLIFLGNDTSSHLAEEVENAGLNVPRSMISSVVINGVLGFATLVVMLFVIGDPVAFISSESNFPFVGVFEKVTGSTAGATGMTVVILLVTLTGSFGIVAASSRMLWAFARENGVPCSRWISKVEPRTALPIWSICITALISCLLALIQLGSSATFSALVGLSIASWYSVFIIAGSVMLHKRLTTPSSEIYWGDFKLGRAGVPLTILALAFSVIGWIFSFFPPVVGLSVATFNWSLVVYFGILGLAMVWWVVRARHIYTGPKVETTRRVDVVKN